MKVRDRIKELRRVKAKELMPNPANWRTHPKAQKDALKGVLAEVGYAAAALARELPDGTLMLIDGHLRAETTPDMEIPVLVLDVDEDEAKLLLASFDPLGAMAETDAAALQSLLADVKPDSEAVQEMLDELLAGECVPAEPQAGNTDPDDVPEDVETITKPGDLWILGDHQLLCGDCTKPEDVARVMDGEKAGLMNTDPPYGISYDVQDNYDAANQADGTHRKSKYAAIKNDELTEEKLQSFLEDVIRTAVPHLNENAAFYLWHPMLTQGTFFAAAAAADILIHRQIIWIKPHFIFGRGDYHWKHELCFYGWVKGNRPPWHGERNQDTVWELNIGQEKSHPSQKPVELFSRPILNHTKAGDVVYEPFCGSGSQIIAAEQLSRRCFAIEIEPRYCDVAVKRWENFTGRKAERA